MRQVKITADLIIGRKVATQISTNDRSFCCLSIYVGMSILPQASKTLPAKEGLLVMPQSE